MKKLIFTYIFLSILSCTQNKSPENTKKENISQELPNTPESVVRTWEENINKNQFNIPRQISVDEALTVVNAIAGPEESKESDIVPLEVIDIKCNENGDEAECIFTFKDDFGQRSNKYSLVKNKGQWYLSKIEDSPKKIENRSPRDTEVNVTK